MSHDDRVRAPAHAHHARRSRPRSARTRPRQRNPVRSRATAQDIRRCASEQQLPFRLAADETVRVGLGPRAAGCAARDAGERCATSRTSRAARSLLGFHVRADAARRAPIPAPSCRPPDREVFARLWPPALEAPGREERARAVVRARTRRAGASSTSPTRRAASTRCFITLPAEEELADRRARRPSAPRSWPASSAAWRCSPRVEIVRGGSRASGQRHLAAADVHIQNAGIVPTSKRPGALPRAAAPTSRCAWTSAKLVATAKPERSAPYTDASFQVRELVGAGTLAGGEGRWMRLFRRLPRAEVRVTTSSPWAGVCRRPGAPVSASEAVPPRTDASSSAAYGA